MIAVMEERQALALIKIPQTIIVRPCHVTARNRLLVVSIDITINSFLSQRMYQYHSGSTTTSTTSLVRSATPPSPILRSATPPRTVFPGHAQEDLTAHAKLDVRERALVGLEGWGHAIKAAVRNADVSEELNKTARAFTAVDANVRSTQQSLEKITASMTQLQDRTTTLLDSLRLVTQINESLQPQDMMERKPPEVPSGGGILSGTASNVVGVLGRFVS